ncbi:MAG: AAA family ATPase, partial [Acidobacteriota bacterium]
MSSNQQAPAPLVRIFVSYSHKDSEYLRDDSLLGFLRGLEQDEGVEIWTDERIGTGSLWDEEIRERIASSHIALVLVSQAFLDSAYCREVELREFLERRRRDGMLIFPVILSPSEWERHDWLASHQFLPGGDETIEENYQEPGRRKRLFLRIRRDLRSVIDQARRSLLERDAEEPPEAQVEKRRLTMMHCEIVPFEADGTPVDAEELPEILHELMPEFQQICSQVVGPLDGHVAQRLGGGVLIYFGYPVAHEDDSRRAVRAGLALIQAMQALRSRFREALDVEPAVRVGIHTGWVVGAMSGPDAEQTLTQGEALSVAGQLLRLAEPDSVRISEATHRLVKDFFECVEEEDEELEGASDGTRVFRVTRDIGVETRFQAAIRKGLTPLVGREEELALLLDRWDKARDGRGQVVMVSAEAGVGKSRLLTEVKERIGRENLTLVECQCSPYHRNSALYPLVGAIQTWLGHDRTDPDEVRLTKLERALERLFGEVRDEVVPLVASLLSIPYQDRYEEPRLSPRKHKEKLLDVTASILIESALHRPVLMIVEDLHWGDPSTLEWLGLVAEQVPTVPLLAVLAFRPDWVPPTEWSSWSHAGRINLGPLTRDQTTEMVERITGGKTLPAEVFEELYRRTEGFPLFVEDLTRSILESDVLVETETGYRLVGPLDSLSIPATLQEALLARLERLESARPLAQMGAVIGREFLYEMLQAIAALDEETLSEELNRLVSMGLLFRRGLLSRGRYIFKHALVQEALQQSLLKRQRRQYHASIAGVLETSFPDVVETQPEVLGYHHTEARQFEEAIDYWIRAAQRATENMALQEAVNHVQAGLELIDKTPEGPERDQQELMLHTLQGPALLALKGWASPELGACFRRARELCRTIEASPQVFQVLRGLWTHHMVSARLREALEMSDSLWEIAEHEESDDLRLEAHASYCDTLFWYGDPQQSRDHARRGFELYDADRHHEEHSRIYGEDPATMFYTYSALSLWLLGFPEQSKAFNRRALDMAERWTHAHSRCFLLCGVAWNHVQM